MTTSPSVAELMAIFGRIDRRGLTVRDMLVMWVIITKPGCMGTEVANKLGLPERSSVQTNIDRLIREKLIEDRRKEIKKMFPNQLYITDAGKAFWEAVVL